MVSVSHLYCSSLSNHVVAESKHLIGQKVKQCRAQNVSPDPIQWSGGRGGGGSGHEISSTVVMNLAQ